LTPSPRRVVILSAGIEEPGGAARRSRIITSGLADRGWQVRVITRAGTLDRFGWRRAPNLTILEVPGFGKRRLGAVLFVCCALPLGLVWGRRAAAFVAIQLLSQTTVAAVCGLLLRRPYIALATTSGQHVSEVRYITQEARFRRLRRRLLTRAAFLVGQTAESSRELEVFVGPSRVAILPNPVTLVEATPLNDQPRAVYSGRFSEEKDLPRLLDAWARVAADRSDAVLTLVGEGGNYRSVEERLRARVAEDDVLARTVRFTGWVPDVGPFLREADVYVFPSLHEGMSNALLEACAWERVVVASDIPSNRAVLGDDYTLLYEAGDTEALVAAVRRAFDDDRIRANARAQVAARLPAFSEPAIISHLEQIIDATNSARH
jgi:glycosyltransferase involved in cell wall biosynthesis